MLIYPMLSDIDWTLKRGNLLPASGAYLYVALLAPLGIAEHNNCPLSLGGPSRFSLRFNPYVVGYFVGGAHARRIRV